MFNHSHIRQFSSLFVSLCDFQLITQNSSENNASRQSRSMSMCTLTTRTQHKNEETVFENGIYSTT